MNAWQRARALPAGIWALGFVSLFMDLSSEMIHALLPVYLVTVLGASALEVGVIEGIAEATASITKIFSGAASDWLGKRKLLAVIGYGLAAVAKPVFPLASSVGWLVGARFVDRIGKGIRGAPRDALVADLAPPDMRGASFGLRQSMDTVGAFLGPLAAMVLMAWTADHFQTVFWVAVIPAFIAVALMIFAVREPPHIRSREAKPFPLSRAGMALPRAFWLATGLGALFTLARFSEAFLVLKAQREGLPLPLIPAVLVLMNIVYALAAYPAGMLSDRPGGRTLVMSIGLAFLIAADLVLAFSTGIAGGAVGIMLWGLHMGFTQGLFAALVADSAPAPLRGTAFGIFNLITGLAMLIANTMAGALWQAHGPQATFMAGAVLAALSAAGYAIVQRRKG